MNSNLARVADILDAQYSEPRGTQKVPEYMLNSALKALSSALRQVAAEEEAEAVAEESNPATVPPITSEATLGDLQKHLEQWHVAGVTVQSIRYVLDRVYYQEIAEEEAQKDNLRDAFRALQGDPPKPGSVLKGVRFRTPLGERQAAVAFRTATGWVTATTAACQFEDKDLLWWEGTGA